jgi:hypothetical protein
MPTSDQGQEIATKTIILNFKKRSKKLKKHRTAVVGPPPEQIE